MSVYPFMRNEQIDKINEAYREIMDEENKMIRCPECDMTNPMGSKKCKDCGTKMKDKEDMKY